MTTPLSELPALMTKRTAAAALEVSEKTIDRYLNDGSLDAVRLGSRPRIRREDLQKFMDSRERW